MSLLRRQTRQLLGAAVAATLLVTSCGGGGDDRSRNVETIAGTACTKRGATKVVSKLNYVCGTASTGTLWFAVVGKLPTKGAKSCKSLGTFEAATTRVCGSVKKKNVWVKVAPLPVAAAGIAETTVAPFTEATTTVTPPVDSAAPDTTTVVTDTTLVAGEVPQAAATTVPNTSVTEPAANRIDEVARALAPEPLPTTREEVVAQLVPRPVEAQAIRLVPTSISVDGGSPTVANGTKFAVPFTVTVRDQEGNPLTAGGNTIVATFSRTNATLTGAVALTDANGVARFDKLRVDGVAGSATITFTSDFGATVGYPLSVTAGAAAAIRVRNHETQIIPLRALSTDPTATLVDKDDNVVERAGVEVTATLNKAVIAKASTNSKGVATFSNFTVPDKLGAPVEVEATIVYAVPSDTNIESELVNVDLVPGAPTRLEIVTQPATTVRAGFTLGIQPVVRLTDTVGNPTRGAGVKVTAYIGCDRDRACGFNGTTTVTTTAAGVATFTNLGISAIAGNLRIGFSALVDGASTPLAVSDAIMVTAGLATSIRVDRSTTVFTYGATVDSAFELAAVDEWGNVVDDFTGALVVSVSAPSGKPDFGYATPATFSAGRLEVKDVVLKGKAGTYGLTFGAGNVSSSQQTATLLAGSPKKLLVLTKPGTISADNNLATPLAVQLVDAGDNTVQVPNYQVKLEASGANAFTETVRTSEVGIATFAVTKFSKSGTTTLAYTDPTSVVASASDTVVTSAGSATTISYARGIGGATRSGVAFGQQPIVQVVDAQGNNVLQPGISVTARIDFGGAPNPRLTSATVSTDSLGRATFTALTLTGKAALYSLSFTPQGGSAGPAWSVNLLPGLPAALQIATQPAGAVNRKALTTQPVVQLLDSAGNAVPQDDIVVTATVDGASTTAKTTSNGTATFSGVTATGVVGERTVRFSVSDWPAASAVTSAKFTMTAGDAVSLAPTTTVVSTWQGGAIPNVVAKDVDNNVTTLDRSVIVSATSSEGLAWLLGSTVSVWRNGVADFTGTTVWSTDRAASLTYQLSGRAMQTTARVSFLRGIQVGVSDRGPAGGLIVADLKTFPSIASALATASTGLSDGGRYIEAAPAGWSGSSTDPTMQWGFRTITNTFSSSSLYGASAAATRSYLTFFGLTQAGTTGSLSAMERVANAIAGGKDDWLLPTLSDLAEVMDIAIRDNSILNLTFTNNVARYWSSSYEYGAGGQIKKPVLAMTVVNEGLYFEYANQTLAFPVRPIRYFG